VEGVEKKKVDDHYLSFSSHQSCSEKEKREVGGRGKKNVSHISLEREKSRLISCHESVNREGGKLFFPSLNEGKKAAIDSHRTQKE